VVAGNRIDPSGAPKKCEVPRSGGGRNKSELRVYPQERVLTALRAHRSSAILGFDEARSGRRRQRRLWRLREPVMKSTIRRAAPYSRCGRRHRAPGTAPTARLLASENIPG
jgi:hypothetical protein